MKYTFHMVLGIFGGSSDFPLSATPFHIIMPLGRSFPRQPSKRTSQRACCTPSRQDSGGSRGGWHINMGLASEPAADAAADAALSLTSKLREEGHHAYIKVWRMRSNLLKRQFR
jgi:hypothetical protein